MSEHVLLVEAGAAGQPAPLELVLHERLPCQLSAGQKAHGGAHAAALQLLHFHQAETKTRAALLRVVHRRCSVDVARGCSGSVGSTLRRTRRWKPAGVYAVRFGPSSVVPQVPAAASCSGEAPTLPPRVSQHHYSPVKDAQYCCVLLRIVRTKDPTNCKRRAYALTSLFL